MKSKTETIIEILTKHFGDVEGLNYKSIAHEIMFITKPKKFPKPVYQDPRQLSIE